MGYKRKANSSITSEQKPQEKKLKIRRLFDFSIATIFKETATAFLGRFFFLFMEMMMITANLDKKSVIIWKQIKVFIGN